MARTGWHIIRDATALTLARRLPVRFDLCERACLSAAPGVSRSRLAHQVRQDIWRALQHIRGYSPIVRISQTAPPDEAVLIEAGGQRAAIRGAGGATALLRGVLDDPANRRRWLAHASRAGQGS